jgi:protein SERAC1
MHDRPIPPSHLAPISGTENQNRSGDVVFVHGLNGDAYTTWHPEDQPEQFWPSWIGEDLSDVGIWSVGYPVSPFEWRGSTMPLRRRAVNILDLLRNRDLGTNRPIVFITHSLGGLLVKEMLFQADNRIVSEGRALAENTKGIVFLSTPHAGSELANFVRYLGFLLPSVSVEELQTQEPRLSELNTWYRNNVERLDIQMRVYYESQQTPSGNNFFGRLISNLVVNAASADPGIAGVTAVPMDYDHITISRPERTSNLYTGIKRFVDECLVSSEDSRDLPEESIQVFPESLNYPDCPQKCQQVITKPGALLRIKAPRQMGKTFLLDRVLADAQEDFGYRIAKVNLWKASIDTRRDLDRLLPWLCEQICLELRLTVDVFSEWQSTTPSTPNSKCTNFFNSHFLNNSQPLLLGLDSLDLIFNYPKVADDFLGLIRGWHEDKNETWQRLRMIIVHMQHYETTIIDHSPLNVGDEITLLDLTLLQIQDLVIEYGLNWNGQDIQRLTDLVGGHPLLIRLALRHISNDEHTLASLLRTAHTVEGVYFNYLYSHLLYLKSNEDLATIMREVVRSVIPVQSYDCRATRKLKELGLIKFENNDVIPANQLLRLYLHDQL